ncbi:hypothetical protein X731_03690 [Mesorhizobium sp. L2C054A000]|nr:hypothetical protein X731_03690 [Mesorhizobium sp. L2C054A000]
MRRSTIVANLDTARNNLTTSLADYAAKRARLHPPYGQLPGEFLDQDGAKTHQFGLTAIALWIAISDHSDTIDSITSLINRCKEVFGDTRRGAIKDPLLEKLQEHYRSILVKRCLCLLALETPAELEQEIQFLLENTAGPKQRYAGWQPTLRAESDRRSNNGGAAGKSETTTAEQSDPEEGANSKDAANNLITAYVLMAIADAMQRFDLKADGLSTEVRARLEQVLDTHRANANRVSDSGAYNHPIHSLFYINCIYRMRSLGFSGEDLNDVRQDLRRLLVKIYNASAIDPAYVGTEIIAFYTDSGKDRYFRFNIDAILLESHFFAYGETLAAFQNMRGKLIFQRVMKNYSRSDFRIDSNGQRLTIYAAYHVLRVIRLLQGAVDNRRSDKWWGRIANWWSLTVALVRTEFDFNRPAIARLVASTTTLSAIALVAFLSASDEYRRGFSFVFLLAGLGPLSEFLMAKLTERLTLGRMM